jgi:hypothetical protein
MRRDSLDESLGLGPQNALPQVQVLSPGHGYDNEVTVVSAEDDREFARRNIREIIENSKNALESMIGITESTGGTKEATALAKLVDSLVSANESLVTLNEKSKPESVKEQSAGVINNTQNVMMVGSGDDLLKVVKKMRGDPDEEEDSLER